MAHRQLNHSSCEYHTNSQSETAKVGAVNGASTNRPFTNWRPEMHGKMELG